MQAPRSPRRAHLLGLGLDNEDGHKRITTAEQFTVLGGSAETHERATETLMKTFEDLKSRRRTLEEVEPQELAEILHKNASR